MEAMNFILTLRFDIFVVKMWAGWFYNQAPPCIPNYFLERKLFSFIFFIRALFGNYVLVGYGFYRQAIFDNDKIKVLLHETIL